MKSTLYVIIIAAIFNSAFAEINLNLPTGPLFDVNQNLRFAMELTTTYNDPFEESDYASLALDAAKKLQDFFPGANEIKHKSEKVFTFQDGENKKEWTIEIDGNLKKRPIVEITTPYVTSAEADIFEKTFRMFELLPATPIKSVGGGHVRIKIHKGQITPTKLGNILKAYYSYQDFILFSFRHLKRSHNTAAPSLAEKNYFDDFEKVIRSFPTSDVTYDELRNANYADPLMEKIGGFMIRKGIMTSDAKAFDKFFAFNIGRLHKSYHNKNKNHLQFEFRLFDAPRTNDEARLHLKFIKALFNLALNSDFNYERKYAGHDARWRTSKYFYTQALKEVTQKLNLNYKQFEYLVEETRRSHR